MHPTSCLQRLRATFIAAMAAAASFGCAYPRTIHVYDEQCQITARQMVLDVIDLNVSRSCSGNHCVSQLVAQAAVLAASTVISGSIVVTGNVVYWLEKKRNCRPKPASSGAIEADAPE
jgi:hypothetical protein